MPLQAEAATAGPNTEQENAVLKVGDKRDQVVELRDPPDRHEAICPGCGQELRRGTILCVQCGYHLKEGRCLATEVDDVQRVGEVRPKEREPNFLFGLTVVGAVWVLCAIDLLVGGRYRSLIGGLIGLGQLYGLFLCAIGLFQRHVSCRGIPVRRSRGLARTAIGVWTLASLIASATVLVPAVIAAKRTQVAQEVAAYIAKDDYEKAIAVCSEAIRLNPKDTGAYFSRGFACGKNREFDKAIADYSEVIRIDPNNTLAYCNRGDVYTAKGEFDKAIADCTAAIRLDVKCASAFLNRGIAHMAKRNFDEAIADYNDVIRLDPKNANAFRWRGAVYIGKGAFDTAIVDLTEAIRLEPKHSDSYFWRGTAYKRARQMDKADADFAKAKELGYKPQN
jgi:Flp pilus assembly protein TadD